MSDGLPSPSSANFAAKLREFALVGLGLTQDRSAAFVRLRDLQQAGIITASPTYLKSGQGTPISGPGSSVGAPEPDLSPPPAPGGFVATAGITQILFETAAPIYPQGHGHARTRIYAAAVAGGTLPTFSAAVLYTDFPGNVGVAPFDPASSLRLWATWVSVDGVESAPAGGTNGVAAATGLLEDQHIANMVVGKLLAGTLAVGQYMQSPDYVAGVSGWRLGSLAGGGAFFEMRGNAVFGGTIYAAAGTIGGSTIGSNYMRSTNYVLSGQGWNLQSDGTGQIGGLAIGATYIQSTNFVAGTSGYRFNFNGVFQSKNFNIDAAGNATFSGALSAASGSFSGSLNAATGSFSGNLNAAGGSFSGNLNACGGSFSGTLNAQVVQSANIVGAAVTSTSFTGRIGTSTSCVLSVTSPSDAQSLVIFFYGGAWDGSTSMELLVNGVSQGLFQNMAMWSIANPSGTYLIEVHFALTLCLLLTKR